MTDKAYAVPLHEQLASVPRDSRLIIDDADGKGTRFIPVGRMCHEAAEALRARLAQPEEQSVGDLYAHRLAVMLECALLDRPGSWDDAHALLDEYRTALRHYTIAFDKKRVSGFGKD